MRIKVRLFITFITLIAFFCGRAAFASNAAWICDTSDAVCGGSIGGRANTASAAYPSHSSSISLNPSAVPLDQGFGVESIYYRDQYDFAIVKGLGRIGAAISPANNDETFFGPPGFEFPLDYQQRKMNRMKYPQQTFAFATAFNIFKNGKSDIKRLELNIGAVLRYNTVLRTLHPGTGLNAIAGPFTFGWSILQDEVVLTSNLSGFEEKTRSRFTVQTLSAGISLTNVALDYSVLQMSADQPSTVSVLTASLLLPRVITTVAARTETSDRPAYNFQTQMLEFKRVKQDYFGAVQYGIGSHVMIGLFYNLYLLHEVSAGLTLFL